MSVDATTSLGDVMRSLLDRAIVDLAAATLVAEAADDTETAVTLGEIGPQLEQIRRRKEIR